MNNALQTTTSAMDTSEPDAIIEAIVTAIADAEGTSPLELEPLADVIDPDALAALFRDDGSTVTVEFRYHDARVCVSSGDRLTVQVFGAD